MALTATAVRPDPKTTRISKQTPTGSGARSGLKLFVALDALFSFGDPKTDLYLVESGVVAVYEPRLEGHQAIIEFAFPATSLVWAFYKRTPVPPEHRSRRLRTACLSARKTSWSPMILERKPDWQTPSSASLNFFAGPRSNSVARIRLAALQPSCSRYRVKTSRKGATRWC